jgi:lipoprotein-anchoring transpeptidase ErfK/SrfK
VEWRLGSRHATAWQFQDTSTVVDGFPFRGYRVGMKKIVVGLAALAAVGALAACSTASASGRSNTAAVVHTTSAAATSTVDTTSSSAAPTTTATPVVTTKKAIPPAVKPVVQPPVVPAAAPAVTGVPCVATAKACVSLSERKAWLIENGQVVLGPVSIMPGRPGFRTPVGTFHVLSKVAHYWSHAFNAPMPEATFFYPGVAFHIGSLSVPSHGCIHMSPSSATTFFNTLSIGDEVQVLS